VFLLIPGRVLADRVTWGPGLADLELRILPVSGHTGLTHRHSMGREALVGAEFGRIGDLRLTGGGGLARFARQESSSPFEMYTAFLGLRFSERQVGRGLSVGSTLRGGLRNVELSDRDRVDYGRLAAKTVAPAVPSPRELHGPGFFAEFSFRAGWSPIKSWHGYVTVGQSIGVQGHDLLTLTAVGLQVTCTGF
jgi:hypothetical protein